MQNHQGAAVGTCGHRSEDLTNKLLTRTHLVSDIEAVKALACRVLRIHELRGADALQLGAASLGRTVIPRASPYTRMIGGWPWLPSGKGFESSRQDEPSNVSHSPFSCCSPETDKSEET